jgi:hypothetical protein
MVRLPPIIVVTVGDKRAACSTEGGGPRGTGTTVLCPYQTNDRPRTGREFHRMVAAVINNNDLEVLEILVQD